MRLVHLLRVRLFSVFPPAQMPQPRAGIAGAGRGVPDVALPDAALTCLPGQALGAGQRTIGAA